MNSTITAVIIDDEEKGRMALREKLRQYCPEVKLLGEAEDGVEGLILIQKKNPSIVFLDIEMPRMNGFEMIQALPQFDFILIFTTAYDHYAIKAIRFAAFDYLLKPVDIEELKSAISRARSDSTLYTGEKLDVLHENLNRQSIPDRIAIPTQEGFIFYSTSQIIQLKAESNYTYLYFKDHPKILASRTLKEFEELLTDDLFFRPHHSHIVNLRFIKRYIRGDGGQIELRNGNFVPVSRRKKKQFLMSFRQNW